MKHAPVQIRHGDVYLNPVVAIPRGAVAKTTPGPIILALGEATGHSHTITAEALGGVLYFWDGERRYLEVTAPAVLDHPEHGPVPVATGRYEVIQQREFALDSQWRKVTD